MVSLFQAPGQNVLGQIPNSHSLGLKTVNNSVTELEIAFMDSLEQSSLSLTRGFKLFITHLHNLGFGLCMHLMRTN